MKQKIPYQKQKTLHYVVAVMSSLLLIALITLGPAQTVAYDATPLHITGDVQSVNQTKTPLTIVDIDQDGDNDILTISDEYSISLTFWVNDGAGNFSGLEGPRFSGAGAPTAAVVSDYDGDGHLDVFLPKNAGRNNIALSGGSALSWDVSVVPGEPTNSQSYGAVAADFDGDLDIDIFVSRFGILSSLMINDGTGSFTVTDVPGSFTSSFDVVAGDFDGDLDIDVYEFSAFGNNVLYVNDGNAVFTVTPVAGHVAASTQGVAEDIDQDGDLDIVSADISPMTEPQIWLNNGDATFTEVTGLPQGYGECGAVDIDDIDQDGDMDVYFGCDGRNAIWLNNGDLTFTVNSIAGDTNSARGGIAIADFNGVGSLELYSRGSDNEQSYLWVTSGTDSAAPITPAAAPDLIAVSDTGDSNTDNVTTDTTPTIEMVCSEPGAVLRLYLDGTLTETATCGASATIQVTLSELASATYELRYTATDSANQTSGLSPVLTILVGSDAAPVLVVPRSPTVVGTADPESNVTLTVSNGQTCEVEADALGDFSCQFDPIPPRGATVSAVAVNTLGFISVESNVVAFSYPGGACYNCEPRESYPNQQTVAPVTPAPAIAEAGPISEPELVISPEPEGVTMTSVCEGSPLTQNLRRGARDGRTHNYTRGLVTEVALLQSHLATLRDNQILIDGIFGPQTESGVRSLQEYLSEQTKSSLAIDGIVGPNTRAVLGQYCSW